MLWIPALYGKEITIASIFRKNENKETECNDFQLPTTYSTQQLPIVRHDSGATLGIKHKNNTDSTAMDHKDKMQKQRKILQAVPPCSQGLGGTVGHAFRRMHTYPPLSL